MRVGGENKKPRQKHRKKIKIKTRKFFYKLLAASETVLVLVSSGKLKWGSICRPIQPSGAENVASVSEKKKNLKIAHT